MNEYKGIELQLHPFLVSVWYGWVANFIPRSLYSREITPATIQWEDGRAPEPILAILTEEKRFAPAGTQTPDRQALGQVM